MRQSLFALLFAAPAFLQASVLETKVHKELELLNLPAPTWRMPEGDMYDVAIVGAGQAGIAIAHALELEGINNVALFDAAKPGEEGPWMTTARMKTLRSGKKLRGPASLPSLTFQAWCEAKYGKEAWEKVGRIPTKAWGKYLQWLQKVLGISVTNNAELEEIRPNPDHTLTLQFKGLKPVTCRKVVLATGRMGFGGAEVPDFMSSLPKKFWAHTAERVDHKIFKDKHVVVIGVGASGFDAAAVACEEGARKVDMLMRREALPEVHHAASFAYPGFMRGFYSLTDHERYDFTRKVLESGVPPPQDSLNRLKRFSNFELIASCPVTSVAKSGRFAKIETAKGAILTDFIVLATGYRVDGSCRPEFASFFDKIKHWQDQMPEIAPKYGRYPYLGAHFEFLEKTPGSAPYLANIHCFNFGSFLSHGRIASDLDGLHLGIERLVEGISIDLFLQDTCRNGEPTPHECPGTCQIGLCSPFSLESGE